MRNRLFGPHCFARKDAQAGDDARRRRTQHGIGRGLHVRGRGERGHNALLYRRHCHDLFGERTMTGDG